MKKNNFNKSKGNFKGKPFRELVRAEAKSILIEEISLNSKGRVSITGVINRIVQTGGPTIFVVTDGTGSLSLKGFIKPGERAYPEINENDVIRSVVEVGEYNGELEGEINSIKKLDDSEKKEFIKNLRALEKEKAKVTPPEFLVKSPILDKLRDRFIEAATQIRLAIIQDRPIIVRHHNDADGYSSGFSLERAIIPLVEKHHSSLKAPWEFFLRAPSQAPYYEIDDSIRDMANSLRNVAKFSNKMPLIIIADNGSTPEDLMGIKQGKVHGADFIVVDHHGFDKDVISSEVLVHISPFLVGEDGSHFSAGMLCTELSRFINPDIQNINQIPAMAGYADRIDLGNPKVMDEYLKIAEKEGYSKGLLADIALVIDYVSAKVRFMEAREYVEVLFGEPRKRQKELVSLMAPYIRDLDRKGLEIGRSNSHHEQIGKVTLQTIEIEDTFPGFGFFPKPGRAVSLVHDNYQTEKKVNSLVTVGIMSTAMTIRATDEANFSFHELLKFVNKKSPESFASGGGHKNAGSLTFLPYKKEEVLNLLREFLKGR